LIVGGGNIFSRKGEIVDFSMGSQTYFFQRGVNSSEISFCRLEREKHFSTKRLIGKYQISKPREAKIPYSPLPRSIDLISPGCMRSVWFDQPCFRGILNKE